MWLILAVCCAFYFTAIFLYHLMVFRVNKNLPFSERIPHSLTFGQRDRLATEYRAFYPRSNVYQLTVVCVCTLIILAAIFAGVRIWEVVAGG
jgi:thiosulfate reductase cytochrome b subunit